MAAEVSPPRRLALPACGACRLFAAPTQAGFQIFGGYGMVVAGAKGGEGMGRAAAAEVRGGWVGMVLRVQASPDHAPAARAPLLGRPAGAVAPAVERSVWWFPSTFCTNGKFSWQLSAETVANPPKGRRAGADS